VVADKIVILSGSGLSAESGLPTFRDAAGLWRQYSWRDLASLEGWRRHPGLVPEFYNERRAKAWAAEPNAAHRAIAELEQKFDVTVITQNVDALHERAGSHNVLHVYGELAWARGTGPSRKRYRIEDAPIRLGQTPGRRHLARRLSSRRAGGFRAPRCREDSRGARSRFRPRGLRIPARPGHQRRPGRGETLDVLKGLEPGAGL
jgi:hypothetical protein